MLLAAGILAGLFLLAHYFNTGQTYPFRSLVQLSSVLIIVGIILLFQSILADMMHRARIINEEALYLARKVAYKK